jgi:cytidine deaminase
MLTDEQRKQLVKQAQEARKGAYARYSHYQVGAALLAKSGKVYRGANVENAVYPLSLCAERVAVFKAVIEGEREFEAIAVVTGDGGAPCGACRQVLSEFGKEIVVLTADESGAIQKEITVGDLLPSAFGPQNLPKG